MKKASPIGKEWYGGLKLLKYVTGKTIDEIKSISLEEGYPTDEDLTSSVLINIPSIISAIEGLKCQDLGAKEGDKLDVGIVSGAGAQRMRPRADGMDEAYSHYGAVSYDKNGKITSSIIDASQTNVSFNTEGKITSNLNDNFQTKLERGYDYNMKQASGIGKEWFEQSEAFCKYIKGKTVADVKGIALEDGYPAEEDLLSSVTMHITDFIAVVDEAGAYAK